MGLESSQSTGMAEANSVPEDVPEETKDKKDLDSQSVKKEDKSSAKKAKKKKKKETNGKTSSSVTSRYCHCHAQFVHSIRR